MSVGTQEAATYAVRAADLWKVYGAGEAQVVALRGVSVALEITDSDTVSQRDARHRRHSPVLSGQSVREP